jgi:hypothetical protein
MCVCVCVSMTSYDLAECSSKCKKKNCHVTSTWVRLFLSFYFKIYYATMCNTHDEHRDTMSSISHIRIEQPAVVEEKKCYCAINHHFIHIKTKFFQCRESNYSSLPLIHKPMLILLLLSCYWWWWWFECAIVVCKVNFFLSKFFI